MDPLPPDSARQTEDGHDEERRIDVYVRIIADDEQGGAGLTACEEIAPPARRRKRRPQ